MEATARLARPFTSLILGAVLLSACGINSAKKHYILAEKLWANEKYAESVSEFEKVIKRDPHGDLGLKALFRAAMTETIFLNRHLEAIRKFRIFSEVSKEKEVIWSAKLQIGEILFNKIKRYKEAIKHYEAMVQERPQEPKVPEFLYRIGKSHFHLWNFKEAVAAYEDLTKRFPDAPEVERATYQIGVTYFTGGGKNLEKDEVGDETELYKKAIKAFEVFIKKYPLSRLVPEAQFGIASCYAELDQLQEAFSRFKAIEETYPSPKVIKIKLIRIRERLAQRNR